MADEYRRVETTDERPRDTVVVKEGKRSIWPIVLGIIIILLVIFWLFGNPFAGNTDVVPDVDIPNEVNIEVPNPDVNLPDVNVDQAPEGDAGGVDSAP